MNKMLKKFFKNTSGNVVVTTAIVLIPVALAAGAAMDYTRMANNQSLVQNVVDSAALVGAKTALEGNINDIEEAADIFLKANLGPEEYAKLGDIEVIYSQDTGDVTVTATSKTPTSFLRIAGIDDLTYSPTATVRLHNRKVEIVLVLDSTGSMSFDGKMDSLKASARDFVDDMMKLNTNIERVKIGIVPFAQYVNVGMSNRNANWMDVPNDYSETRTVPVYEWQGSNDNCSQQTYYVDGVPQTRERCSGSTRVDTGRTREETVDYTWSGCVGSRKKPFNLRDTNYNHRIPGLLNTNCPSEITPLTADQNRLKSQINGLVATGSTYIPGGLIWGMRAISSQKPFNEGVDPSASSTFETDKVIVLMTDGENQASADIPHAPTHNGTDYDEADDLTEKMCDNLKNEDIKVYTIGFGTNIPDDTKNLLINCSTDSKNYLAAADGAALSASFDEIAAQLAKLYISK